MALSAFIKKKEFHPKTSIITNEVNLCEPSKNQGEGYSYIDIMIGLLDRIVSALSTYVHKYSPDHISKDRRETESKTRKSYTRKRLITYKEVLSNEENHPKYNYIVITDIGGEWVRVHAQN